MSRDRELAAYQYAQDRKALVGVVVLTLMLFVLDQVFNEPDRGGVGLVGMAGLGTASSPTDDGTTNSGSGGTLTAGGTSLLPLSEAATPDGSLAEYVGEPAVGRGVTVLSVPADEGFWIGTSDADRVWVQLIGPGESPYVVRPGDTVSFDGVVVAHGADFPGRVGVGRDEGADRLADQDAHIEVAMDELSFDN